MHIAAFGALRCNCLTSYDVVTAIKDHLAFYPDRMNVVEERA
jgi:hypothetical protein